MRAGICVIVHPTVSDANGHARLETYSLKRRRGFEQFGEVLGNYARKVAAGASVGPVYLLHKRRGLIDGLLTVVGGHRGGRRKVLVVEVSGANAHASHQY